MTNEIRSIQTELRSTEVEGKRVIEGYACCWDALSSYVLKGPRGPFRERIASDVFDDSIVEDDIGCYFDHSTQKILGRTRSGTVTLLKDDHGLLFRCELPDTTYADDLVSLITRGDIYGCSMGFRNFSYEWDQDQDGQLIGTLVEGRLFDVGPVSQPVYEMTSVTLRSIDHYLDEKQHAREWRERAGRRLRMQDQKSKQL